VLALSLKGKSGDTVVSYVLWVIFKNFNHMDQVKQTSDQLIASAERQVTIIPLR